MGGLRNICCMCRFILIEGMRPVRANEDHGGMTVLDMIGLDAACNVMQCRRWDFATDAGMDCRVGEQIHKYRRGRLYISVDSS